ncbi:type IV toxin-antitoxin system AbiEi family antitoxin domain-containing protein [Pseudonocardia sp. HH130629-09]|uniref:type IV toxin-antitoxin system AbiEi family antitoxin domain-containing protein n=1 Tax=Pseudonocardia sp. HH130629-09 TaxID=1641402 RepID=UPI0007611134|nr:type IV toxin-antitoxin system AbiEi family antitoxin domain-containing protein [Pseudonocardia sp. HH130629-09]
MNRNAAAPLPSALPTAAHGAVRRSRTARGADPLARLFAAQDGLVTRAQALAHGLSTDQVDRRLAARRWIPVHPRVYRHAAHRPSERSRVRAAVLWAGEDAVLTGAAAAWWWGLLPGAPAVVTVTVPRRRAPRSRAGVLVRRRDLDPLDVTTHDGVVVARPAAAVLDGAADPAVPGDALLDHVLGTGSVGVAELVEAHSRNLGAHGSGVVGRMLAGASRRIAVRARHGLRALLAARGVQAWRTDVTVAGVLLDLAFPAARLAVEVHDPVDAGTGADGCGSAWRRAVLRRHGWRTLVVEPAELRCPEELLARLHEAVTGHPAGPGGAAGRAAG